MASLDHVNIVVTDMDRSVRFYQELLGLKKGFECVLRGEWIDQVTGLDGVEALCVFMESANSPVRLELLQYLHPTGTTLPENSLAQLPGVRHIAFRVEDLDSFCKRAIEQGVKLVSGPVLVPFPLPGGRRKRLCYFYDPDGVLLEAAEYSDGEG